MPHEEYSLMTLIKQYLQLIKVGKNDVLAAIVGLDLEFYFIFFCMMFLECINIVNYN